MFFSLTPSLRNSPCAFSVARLGVCMRSTNWFLLLHTFFLSLLDCLINVYVLFSGRGRSRCNRSPIQRWNKFSIFATLLFTYLIHSYFLRLGIEMRKLSEICIFRLCADKCKQDPEFISRIFSDRLIFWCKCWDKQLFTRSYFPFFLISNSRLNFVEKTNKQIKRRSPSR